MGDDVSARGEGSSTGPGRDSQRQSERLEYGECDLQVRQSGPMIIAVTALQEPVRALYSEEPLAPVQTQ